MNVFNRIKKRGELAYRRICWVRWVHRCETKQLYNRVAQRKANLERKRAIHPVPPENPFEVALLADNKIADDTYADHIYCAIENSGIYDLEDNLVCDYGQRDCGWMLADLRNKGDYLDYVWQHTKDDLTYIHEDLKRLGFKVGAHPSLLEDYQYSLEQKKYVKLPYKREKLFQTEWEVFVSEKEYRRWVADRPEETMVIWCFADDKDNRVMELIRRE